MLHLLISEDAVGVEHHYALTVPAIEFHVAFMLTLIGEPHEIVARHDPVPVPIEVLVSLVCARASIVFTLIDDEAIASYCSSVVYVSHPLIHVVLDPFPPAILAIDG
jgi:hypothetical protein